MSTIRYSCCPAPWHSGTGRSERCLCYGGFGTQKGNGVEQVEAALMLKRWRDWEEGCQAREEEARQKEGEGRHPSLAGPGVKNLRSHRAFDTRSRHDLRFLGPWSIFLQWLPASSHFSRFFDSLCKAQLASRPCRGALRRACECQCRAGTNTTLSERIQRDLSP